MMRLMKNMSSIFLKPLVGFAEKTGNFIMLKLEDTFYAIDGKKKMKVTQEVKTILNQVTSINMGLHLIQPVLHG